MKHNYTLSGELPELVQAKLNAMNISEVKPYIGTFSQSKSSSLMFSRWNWVCPSDTFQTQYKESWKKIRDGGYKLRLDAIPFQSAKASAEILSDVRIHFIIWNHIITIF